MPYYPPASASGAPVDATYITQSTNGVLSAEYVLTAGTNITLTPGAGILTVAATSGGGSSLPVADTQTLVMGSVDNTKLLRFEIDGFTAGATRVLTPPNADATIAGLEVANVFTRTQTIDGSQDEIQLIIEASITQTAPVFVIQTNGGASQLMNSPNGSNLRLNNPTQAGAAIPAGGIELRGNVGVLPTVNSVETMFKTGCASGKIPWALRQNSTRASNPTLVWFETSNGNLGSIGAYANGITLGGNTGLTVGIFANNAFATPQLVVDSASVQIEYRNTVSTIDNILILQHNASSGTPPAGFGLGVLVQGESSTTEDQDMGRLTYEWGVATHASREVIGKLTAFYIATERECIRWRANATGPMVGFQGALAINQPTAYTLASTATRTMPTPETAFTGQDNAQGGAVYAKSADIITLQTRLDAVEGVLRQVIIDLASTSGYGLLVAS